MSHQIARDIAILGSLPFVLLALWGVFMWFDRINIRIHNYLEIRAYHRKNRDQGLTVAKKGEDTMT